MFKLDMIKKYKTPIPYLETLISSFYNENIKKLENLSDIQCEDLFYYMLMPVLGIDDVNQLNHIWNINTSYIYRLLEDDKFNLSDILKQNAYQRVTATLKKLKGAQSWTKSRKRPYLITDDTLTGRHYGQLMDYLKKLFCPAKSCYMNTNNLVVLFVQIENEKFFMDYRLYIPKDEVGYFPKPDLFWQMLKDYCDYASCEGVDLSLLRVLGDGAYTTQKNLLRTRECGLTMTGKANGNWKIEHDNQSMSISDVIKTDLPYKHSADGYNYYVKVTDLSQIDNVKLVYVDYIDDKVKPTAYVTNNPDDMNARTIMKNVKKRWPIETSFEDEKQYCGLEKYQFHNKDYNANPDGKKLKNHISIRFSLLNCLYHMSNKRGRKKQ